MNIYKDIGGCHYQSKVSTWLTLEILLSGNGLEMSFGSISNSEIQSLFVIFDSEPKISQIDVSTQYNIHIRTHYQKLGLFSNFTMEKILKFINSKRKTFLNEPKCGTKKIRNSDKDIFFIVTNAPFSKKVSSIGGNFGENMKPFHYFLNVLNLNFPESIIYDYKSDSIVIGGQSETEMYNKCLMLLKEKANIPSRFLHKSYEIVYNKIYELVNYDEIKSITNSELMALLSIFKQTSKQKTIFSKYVEPISINKIRESFRDCHIIILTGPAGMGKTLTGDMLEYEFIDSNPDFEVIYENRGPVFIYNLIENSKHKKYLFHLRDPWGSNRRSLNAEKWDTVILRLIESAEENRKFIITSKSNMLDSMESNIYRKLQKYMVCIDEEKYNKEKLNKIFEKHLDELSNEYALVAKKFKEDVVSILTRPFEIAWFIKTIKSNQDLNSENIQDIILRSQVETISYMIADKMNENKSNWIINCTIIWIMLRTRKFLCRDKLIDIFETIQSFDSTFNDEFEKTIKYFIENNYIKSENKILSFFHSRTEEGLYHVIKESNEILIKTFSLLIKALSNYSRSDEKLRNMETVLLILKLNEKNFELKLNIDDRTQSLIDKFLISKTFNSNKGSDFYHAFSELCTFGSSNHSISHLANILSDSNILTKIKSDEYNSITDGINNNIIDSIKSSKKARLLIERFVEEYLPFSTKEYNVHTVELIYSLHSKINASFWKALKLISLPNSPTLNFRPIIVGTCFNEEFYFDRAIDLLVNNKYKVDNWIQNIYKVYQRKVEELEVNADENMAFSVDPDKYYLNFRIGIEEILNLKLTWRGVDWILKNKHRDLLISAAVAYLRKNQNVVDSTDLLLLLKSSQGFDRSQVWESLKHFNINLYYDELKRDLLQVGNNEHMRKILILVAFNNNYSSNVPDIIMEILDDINDVRKLELIYDILNMTIKHGSRKINSFSSNEMKLELTRKILTKFQNPISEICKILIDSYNTEKTRISEFKMTDEAIKKFNRMLPKLPAEILRLIIQRSEGLKLDTAKLASKLLAHDDRNSGICAVDSLMSLNNQFAQHKLETALDHSNCHVRSKALSTLIDKFELKNKHTMVNAPKDRSALVRLTWTMCMKKKTWPSAVNILVELLNDNRNFNSSVGLSELDQTYNFPSYFVARSAAIALGNFEELPKSAISALIGVAKSNTLDILLKCASIGSLATKKDDRIIDLLERLLTENDTVRSLFFNPIAQTAAWAFFDRSIASQSENLIDIRFSKLMLKIALGGPSHIAGPIILAFGAAKGQMRNSLEERLKSTGQTERSELLGLMTILANYHDKFKFSNSDQQTKFQSENFSILDERERKQIEKSLIELNTQNDVRNISIWLLNKYFGLVNSVKVKNPKNFVMPRTIPVTNLGSIYSKSEPNLIMDTYNLIEYSD